jgi:protein-tyrosine phosphatase
LYDLHNHLLPGIDDGARDWDMALAMARMAYDDGIRGLVFTPHNSAWWNGYYFDKVEPLAAEFKRRLNDAGLPLQIGPGCETYIDLDILQRLKDGRAAPLNHSRYLLMELPFASWPLYTDQVTFELQAAGYTVILAHPERYSAVMEMPEKMQALAERGVIGQVTSGSLEGKFGSRAQKTALLLLENNWAHYIASDAHELVNRTPTMHTAFEILKTNLGLESATMMCSTLPERIFRNEEIVLDAPLAYAAPQRSFFGSLFRR